VPLYKILTAFLAFGRSQSLAKSESYIHTKAHKLAKSFRTISLTSFLLKTMERLVNLHIKEGPLKDYSLNPMQHAFLKGKSTEIALHDLVYKIDGSLSQKEFALGFFLDVEGALNNTSFESMDDAASDHGVCSTITRWIDFMLRSRSVFVYIRRVGVHMSKRRGYPQGGVLSPLL
jgi:hypothetical protein